MKNTQNKVIFNSEWYNNFVSRSNEKEKIISETIGLLGDCSNLSCLEIGMGTNPFFANSLAKNFEEYTILEKENKPRGSLGHNIRLINSDWETFESDEKFDIIIASHVIYYFKDKKKAIDKMLSYLKSNGRLILVVNGKEFDYGLTKDKFAKIIKRDYVFTYDKLIEILYKKEYREISFSTEIKFNSLDELHKILKLSFDNYPDEYLSYKQDLVAFWKDSLMNSRFKIQQRLIIVRKERDYESESLELLKQSQLELKEYRTKILGKEFIIMPEVFSPEYFSDTKRFCEAIKINDGEKILEIGSGTGALSVCSLLKGAGSVFATDINPRAVENTRRNATLHKVDQKLTAEIGDVYSAVPQGMKFDTIIWNGPFLFSTKGDHSYIERSIFDKDYSSFKRTIYGAKNYLKEKGRLIIGFSTTIGRCDIFLRALSEVGGRCNILFKMTEDIGNSEVAKGKFDKIDFELFEIRFD
jgi:methylase of polypeptide subunit release factors